MEVTYGIALLEYQGLIRLEWKKFHSNGKENCVAYTVKIENRLDATRQ